MTKESVKKSTSTLEFWFIWIVFIFKCKNTVSLDYGFFGNNKWYKSLISRVEDEWHDKTFVSRLISKTPNSHFHNHSISIVQKYKQAIKWKEISHVTVKVKGENSLYWLLLESLVFTPILWSLTHMSVHWLKYFAITFNLHVKLFYSFSIIVAFNNVTILWGGPHGIMFSLPSHSHEC